MPFTTHATTFFRKKPWLNIEHIDILNTNEIMVAVTKPFTIDVNWYIKGLLLM